MRQGSPHPPVQVLIKFTHPLLIVHWPIISFDRVLCMHVIWCTIGLSLINTTEEAAKHLRWSLIKCSEIVCHHQQKYSFTAFYWKIPVTFNTLVLPLETILVSQRPIRKLFHLMDQHKSDVLPRLQKHSSSPVLWALQENLWDLNYSYFTLCKFAQKVLTFQRRRLDLEKSLHQLRQDPWTVATSYRENRSVLKGSVPKSTIWRTIRSDIRFPLCSSILWRIMAYRYKEWIFKRWACREGSIGFKPIWNNLKWTGRFISYYSMFY